MFRFSIRELMLVMLVLSMGLGWWLDRSHQASEAGRYKEYLMKMRRTGFALGSMLGQELGDELEATFEAENEYDARHPSKPIVKKR
jgi:hypothetical protein